MANEVYIPKEFLDSLQGAFKGVTDSWPAGVTSMKVDMVDYTQATMETKLQGLLTTFEAPGKLATQHADAVVARDEEYPDAHDFLTKFFQALPAYVGSTAAGLQPYGKAPPKQRAKPTAEQMVVTTQKRNATRKARGTMGKKQKTVSDFRNRLPALDLGRIELRAVA
jgi:hypothetical protein